MKYKSKLELSVAEELGTKAEYEPDKIKFVQPAKNRFYVPDFKIGKDTYIETKGKWTSDDRMKHVWLQEQHPEITIYILFQNSSVKLNKRSKTTYGDWATKNNLKWADYRYGIPKEWLNNNENKPSSRNRKRNSRSTSKPD